MKGKRYAWFDILSYIIVTMSNERSGVLRGFCIEGRRYDMEEKKELED